MTINKFIIQHKHSFTSKELSFEPGTNLIHSDANSTGKTTLLRAILFLLGFPVPNTELIRFEDYEFTAELIIQEKPFTVVRKNNLLTINEQEFDLPTDQSAAHTFMLGISNPEILFNLLGTIYFDQEKGWTLLNRGTIIGMNRFNVESFFRGLKEDESRESYEIVERISALNKKIAQYKLMKNVAEYQAAINQEVEHKLDFQTYQESLDTDLIEKRIQLQRIETELTRLSDIIKKNKGFSDYIESKRVYVINPNGGDPIRVTKDTLFDYKPIEAVNTARRSMLTSERSVLKRQIAKIESSQEQQMALVSLPSADEEMTRRLSNIRNIGAIEVDAMLGKLQKEKKSLSDSLKNRTKTNNNWISEAYEIISSYAKELDIPFDYKLDIFTSNLKSKSGAILHKMVFIYKLAYIKLLSKKIGFAIPIFCDSPSGREVKRETITEMLSVLKRDFSEHQIFIASINKYENVFCSANIYQSDGTLFNMHSLLDKE